MSLPLWDERLAQGESVEAVLRAHLATVGWAVFGGPETSAYDFATHNGRQWFLVEVKDETAQATTGNLCIEVRQGQDKRPSGISTSESNVTIHHLGANTVLYRTQHMRLHLRRERYRPQPFRGADNGNTGVLVPIGTLAQEPWCEVVRSERLHKSRVWEPPFLVGRTS